MRPLGRCQQKNLLGDAMTSDTERRGGSGSGSGNSSQSRHVAGGTGASQHGSTQLILDTDKRGGSGSGSGNSSQTRHSASKTSASQHGSTQLTSDTDRRGGSGSGSGNSSQSRHVAGGMGTSRHGSTQSRPLTRSSEFGAIIRKYLKSNPSTRNKWEEFHNYRGQYVSLMDSLEFFRDHVIPLTTLVSH
jgi:hypothetical protein